MSEAASALKARLAESIGARDRAGAVTAAISAIASGELTIPALYDTLADLLTEIGDSWQAGETRVWEEHYATAVARTIVEACQPYVIEHAAPPIGRTAVFATPSEEYHDLGLRMLADRFTLAGWSAHLLGANVPAHELLSAVRELEADAVVLSAYTHYHRVALKAYVDAVRAAFPEMDIWVGGAAFAFEHDDWPDEMMLEPHEVPELAGRVS